MSKVKIDQLSIAINHTRLNLATAVVDYEMQTLVGNTQLATRARERVSELLARLDGLMDQVAELSTRERVRVRDEIIPTR